MKLEVLGVGQCALDFAFSSPTYPAVNTKIEFDRLNVSGGGPVGNALCALSKWGLQCSIAGIIGDDDFGIRIENHLAEQGVDTEGLVVRKQAVSQVAFVAVTGQGLRTIFWRRPTGSPLAPGEVDTAVIPSLRAVHTDGLYIQAALTACRQAKKSGVPVIVDGGTLRDGMLELAAAADVYVVSSSFCRALTGDDPREACRILSDKGVRVAGVTLGDKGYVAYENGVWFEEAARRVEAADTTGCGDVFHAGLTYGVTRGWSTGETLKFANWAAGRAATGLGAGAGVPRLTEDRPWLSHG